MMVGVTGSIARACPLTSSAACSDAATLSRWEEIRRLYCPNGGRGTPAKWAVKEGKLPSKSEREEYALEYGTAVLEVHTDAIQPGERVLIVDDVLATGGTARATARLVERLGGKVMGIACLIELAFLNGRDKLAGYDFFSLITF